MMSLGLRVGQVVVSRSNGCDGIDCEKSKSFAEELIWEILGLYVSVLKIQFLDEVRTDFADAIGPECWSNGVME